MRPAVPAPSNESRDAVDAGDVIFMPAALVQCPLPYVDPKDVAVWTKSNGRVSILIRSGIAPAATSLNDGRQESKATPPVTLGLPFGSTPRLLLSWIATEAIRTKSPEIRLGTNLTTFMSGLGLNHASGGRGGSITRLKDQMQRLFGATISLLRVDESGRAQDHEHGSALPAACPSLWARGVAIPPDPIGSTISLSDSFYREVIEHSVPLNARNMIALRRSAPCLDVYAWLTWQYSFLRIGREFSWAMLRQQFGTQAASERKFRETFRAALQRVLSVYPEARVDAAVSGLILTPSPTSVRRKSR